MKKIFVTGGAGFIGSVLVNQLLSLGKEVMVYDNFTVGKRKFLNFKSPNLTIVRGDVRNFKLLKESMKGYDFVFHFAANSDVSKGIKNSRLDFDINTVGTLNVLDSMVKNKIKFLVYASSSAVFGYPTKFPTPENYGPCLPDSFYGASKLCSEGYVSAFAKLHTIKSWIFRFANITGNPATHGVIYDFMKKLRQSKKDFKVLGVGNFVG